MRKYRTNVTPLAVGILLAIAASRFADASSLAVLGDRPSPSLAAAVQAAGWSLSAEPSAGDALLIEAPIADKVLDAAVPAVSGYLSQGKTVFVATGGAVNANRAFEDLLPVNLWSARLPRYARGSCGAMTGDGAAFPAASLTGFALSSRFDLHLPYAPIEQGEHRYSWARMEKDLLDTDWRVLLTCDQDGHLPLLVDGRVGAGRVVVFAGGLNDTALVAWKGYPAFVASLLALAAKAVPATDTSAESLTVTLDRYQAAGLVANVRNGSDRAARALLAYKVANMEHQLLNSATTEISVPAHGSIAVRLVERSPLLGDAVDSVSGDSLPFRWVRVGLAPIDRSKLLSETSALVDVSPARTLTMAAPDIRYMPDLATWPDRATGALVQESAPISQYVARVGEAVPLTVRLANGLHDIAPLAAVDVPGSDDPGQGQGLNDLCYTHGSLRGTLPLYGTWSTKSAGEATLAYRWADPVTVAGQVLCGQTDYRFWSRSNPKAFALTGTAPSGPVRLADATDAAYANAVHRDRFSAQTVTACSLRLTALPAKAPSELGTASLAEWEILGWPGTTPPSDIAGRLVVIRTEPDTGRQAKLLDQDVSVRSVDDLALDVTVPGRADFGPVAVDATFTSKSGETLTAHRDLFFVDDHLAIKPNPHDAAGLLCESGFSQMEPFGTGTQAGSSGWCGSENGIWAVTHDLMEIGSRSADQSSRLFTTAVSFTHYSTPWRDFPDGQYYWDAAEPALKDLANTPTSQKAKTANVFLSDRWNGITVYADFSWANFVAFDKYLREKTGKGLTGRSRAQIVAEITANDGDVWQRWLMDRYADKLIASQKAVADQTGVKLTVTTHGSFPLAGGDLGKRIAQTHVASGTDLFWELRDEDLYKALGYRFGLIAANPDYESGAYNEWGWTSAALSNEHWFGYAGSVEPARRQWYSTYFAGRVDSAGAFDPLTVYGYYAQGAPGPKTTADDLQKYYRTMRFVTRVRPEQPAGFGLVASWNEQVRHMGKKAGRLGAGLYAADGYDQIDALAGEVYQRLVKNGVPIGFVASTATLAHWQGKCPLIAVDGLSFTADEIALLKRLNDAGTPIVCIGGGSEATPDAQRFFGVTVLPSGAVAGQGTPVTVGGAPLAFVTKRANAGPVVCCPTAGKDLDGASSTTLAAVILAACENPLTVPPGIAATAFVNHDRLFLALGDQGDANRAFGVSVTPSALNPALTAATWTLVDLDRGVTLPSRSAGGRVEFSLPVAASDGRLVMLVPTASVAAKGGK